MRNIWKQVECPDCGQVLERNGKPPAPWLEEALDFLDQPCERHAEEGGR